MKPRRLILSLAICFIIIPCSVSHIDAQTWAKIYGTSSVEVATAITTISAGGIAVAGHAPQGNASDLWVVRFDVNGNVLWQTAVRGSQLSQEARSIDEDANGDLVITGIEQQLGISSNFKMWVLKLDSGGGILCHRSFGLAIGNDDDMGYDLVATSDGGFIVSGASNSYGAPGSHYVLKFDSSCGVQWQKAYVGTGAGAAFSVDEVLGPTGPGYVVAGIVHSATTQADISILRLDLSGNIIWGKVYGGPLNDSAGPGEFLGSVLATLDGGFLVTASTESFGANARDAWILKLDSAGAIQWEHRYESNSADSAARAQEVPVGGGFVVAGVHDDTDFWGLRIDNAGQVLWQEVYSQEIILINIGTGAADVALAPGGGFYFAGGTGMHSTAGSGVIPDVFVVKVDRDGNVGTTCPFVGTIVSAVPTNAVVTNTPLTAVITNDPGPNVVASVSTIPASLNTVCAGPMIVQGADYCISGVSSGSDYSWLIDLNTNGSVNTPPEPVEPFVLGTTSGQGAAQLASDLVASIQGNGLTAPAGLTATVSSTSPHCLSLTRSKHCDTFPSILCNTHSNCPHPYLCIVPPPPELYVGPPSIPNQCHVTSTPCLYNPEIVKVRATALAGIPTLTEWGIIAAIVLLMGGVVLHSRRRHQRIVDRR